MWLAGEFEVNRAKYMTQEYIKMFQAFAEKVYGKSAMVYAGGPAIHHSDSRNFEGIPNENIVIKTQIGFNVMNVAKVFKNAEFDYISINANTCASSMHCLYEAKQLMCNGYDQVVVVAMDMTENSQLKLFDQLGVDVKCGDGLAIIVLDKHEGIAKIEDVTWKWNCDKSPMSVSKEGYMKVLNDLDTERVTVVKPHGTGTNRNDAAENEALTEVGLGNVPTKMYKQIVGHTQGASTAVEIGMLLDDMASEDRALVLASGMGGFYGGCVLWKL